MEGIENKKKSGREEVPRLIQQVPYDDTFDWDAAFSQDPSYLMNHPEMRDAEEVHRYLKDLGLTIAELKGKRLLDVGAGNAVFTKELTRYGVEAIALDLLRPDDPGHEEVDTHPTPMEEVPTFVQGSAYDLPFGVGVFDFVVSNAGPLNNVHWAEQDLKVENPAQNVDPLTAQYPAISEAIRVLKPGGEVRFCVLLPSRDQDTIRTRLADVLQSEAGITFSKELIAEFDFGTEISKQYRFVIRKN